MMQSEAGQTFLSRTTRHLFTKCLSDNYLIRAQNINSKNTPYAPPPPPWRLNGAPFKVARPSFDTK